MESPETEYVPSPVVVEVPPLPLALLLTTVTQIPASAFDPEPVTVPEIVPAAYNLVSICDVVRPSPTITVVAAGRLDLALYHVVAKLPGLPQPEKKSTAYLPVVSAAML